MTIQFPAWMASSERFTDKQGNTWVPDANGRMQVNLSLNYFLENLFPYGFTLYNNDHSDPVGAAAGNIHQCRGGPVVLAASDSGGVFSNDGCIYVVDYFLPAASTDLVNAGTIYYFLVAPTSGYRFCVGPQLADSFFGAYQTSAAGSRLKGAYVPGNILIVQCALNGATPAWKTSGYGEWTEIGPYPLVANEFDPYS